MGASVRESRVSDAIYLLDVMGHPSLHQSGITSLRLVGCLSPGPRKNDLTIYWAFGPFVRSFTPLVDPGDIYPPQRARVTVDPGRWLRWPRLPDLNAWWRRFPHRWRWLPGREGEWRQGPCAGKRRHFQDRRASGALRFASSDGDAQGSSGVTEGARCAQRQSRMTSSDPA
jgi:hypothetical protein